MFLLLTLVLAEIGRSAMPDGDFVLTDDEHLTVRTKRGGLFEWSSRVMTLGLLSVLIHPA